MRTTNMRDMGLITAAGLALAVFVGGCANTVSGPPGGQPETMSGSAYPAVTVEGGLNQYIVVDYARIIYDAPTATTPMAVTVPVRSISSDQMTVQYEFSWFDKDGRPMGSSGQRFLAIDSGLQVSLKQNATNTQATQWRLNLRAAR